MTFRLNRFSSFAVRLICAGLVAMAMYSPVRAVDFVIENDADYHAMRNGVRAAEYVRQQILEDGAPPRLLIASAGLWVFAERNPLATPTQFAEFIAQFDAQLAQAVPGDPDLFSQGAVQTALRQTHVGRTPLLEGMDTRVSSRLLDLLGLSLPGLGGYDQSRIRMSRFELASVQRLIYRREVAEFLVFLFSNRTPDGQRRTMLAETADAYMVSRGVNVLLGQIDLSQTEINAGLAALPDDFQAFDAARNSFEQIEQIKTEVIDDIEVIQAQGDQLLAELNGRQPEMEQASNTLALMIAASDPADPGHAAAVAELEAIEQALIDRIRETAEARAAVVANTLVMRQSAFADLRAVGVAARDFSSLQLQTNDHLATIQETYGIMGSLIGVGVGIVRKDPWEAIQSLTNVVTGAFGLADLLSDQGPSAEEQIFDQLVEMRGQLQSMQIQLNARLDVVDQKLDIVFSTMNDRFDAIGNQIGDLQESVDDLSAEVARVRSGVERIERALFGFAEEFFLNELTQTGNAVLNYRDNFGVDLPYASGDQNFVEAASFFFTFANSTSKNTAFAGAEARLSLDQQIDGLLALTVDGQEKAIARNLNPLRLIPTGLQRADGEPVQGPLTTARVPAPAPWAQGASAYLQLADESPWYFNFLLANQGAENINAQINQIIRDGERIVELAEATRASDALFDGLFELIRGRIDAFQAVLDDTITAAMPGGTSNASGYLDPWGGLDQPAWEVAPPMTYLEFATFASGAVEYLDIDASSWPFRGFEIVVSDNHDDRGVVMPREEVAKRLALTHLLRGGALDSYEPDLIAIDGGVGPGLNRFDARLWGSSNLGILSVRTLQFDVEVLLSQGWVRLNFEPQASCPPCNVPSGRLVERAWPELGQALISGDLAGTVYATGNLIQPNGVARQSRIRLISDSSETFGAGFTVLDDYLTDELVQLRDTVRADTLVALSSPVSDLGLAATELDRATALLDSYVTLGLGEALNQSEVLRSALRGLPSIAGLGIRGGDVRAMLTYESLLDDGQLTYPDSISPAGMDSRLLARLDGLISEVHLANAIDAPSFPYVELVLAQLRALREQSARLAVDETFAVTGTLAVTAEQGLLANDVGQAGAINDSELAIDLTFFDSPDAIPPSHGELLVQEDGSFSYQPDPGFSGEDRFSYRLRAQVGSAAPSGLAVSEPGVVVLRVIDTSSDTIFADSFD